ncbi:MAG: ABC transporter permease [Helicobacteraceae bacterium]|jgi:phospholipid/cholesterol/gamma-HCH transport system permease protein|nr:ABC transporter permease [Helicobacteraceae bacterium]
MFEKFLYALGKPFAAAARLIVAYLIAIGAFTIFQARFLPIFFTPPLRHKLFARQIEAIGANSLVVVIMTAAFTGMVMSIQLYGAFHQFGAENMMGYAIFLAIGRELGPVFTALMLISRAASAMAAELGTMRVTEQIDAIEALSVNSKAYLIAPRVLAAFISAPILVAVFDLVANYCAYALASYALGVNPTAYMRTIYAYAQVGDFLQGCVKGLVFGYLIAAIATYIGYHAKGGAKGVGLATTQAVVSASVALFLANYFLSSLFLLLNW